MESRWRAAVRGQGRMASFGFFRERWERGLLTDLERCAEDQHEVGLVGIAIDQVVEALGKLLPEEHDVRLHDAAAALHGAKGHPLLLHRFVDLLPVAGVGAALGLVGAAAALEGPVARQPTRTAQPGLEFQRVDVLGVVAQQFPTLLKRANEVVGRRGLEGGAVGAGEDLLGETEEGLRVCQEELHVEHALRVGQVVLPQPAVQPVLRSEVRDAARHAAPRRGIRR